MWLFLISAAALAAAAGALVLARAASASRAVGAEDPTLAVYRRQLAELDELTTRGLLGEDERRSTHTEAARRLLSAAERRQPAEAAASPGSRRLITAAIAAGGIIALALYGGIGSPGRPDSPYPARLAQWRAADPRDLAPAEVAAVLRALIAERPGDVRGYQFLGRAELAAGDAFAAAEAFRRAVALRPDQADLHAMLGEALTFAAEGEAPDEASAAFAEALRLDPQHLSARYFLGRAEIAAGRTEAGLARWRSLGADFAADDPRRPALAEEIEAVERTGALAMAGVSAPGEQDAQEAAFIRSMVASLAARLERNPDDPAGWATLVRSYRVLGDRDAQMQALAEARRRFAGNQEALAMIEVEAEPPPP